MTAAVTEEKVSGIIVNHCRGVFLPAGPGGRTGINDVSSGLGEKVQRHHDTPIMR